VIEDFKNNPDGVELLIVVDKLLTGFDAPRDTVLYLAKPLHDHNLLQAIARVNRVYENKDNEGVPKTAGFIIDYSENARSIKTALQLFGNYDEDDVRGTLIDLSTIENELDAQYDVVNDLFKTITSKNQHDYIGFLVDDEQKRREFGDKLNDFVAKFEEYMTLRDTDYDLVQKYQREIKRMLEIKRSAALQSGEKVDLRKYDLEIKRIMNQNITADEAKPMSEEVEITDTKAFDEVLNELGSDKSKAEAIAAQTKRVITEVFKNHDDEGMFAKFSDKIQDIINRMRANKLSDIEALEQLKLVSDDIKDRRDEDLPIVVRETLGADKLYRNMRDILVVDDYAGAVVGIAKIVRTSATVDWWKNYTKKQAIKNELDDYLYDEFKISDTNKIVDLVVELAASNPELYR
jgi:type I restriction enzyme R subunit